MKELIEATKGAMAKIEKGDHIAAYRRLRDAIAAVGSMELPKSIFTTRHDAGAGVWVGHCPVFNIYSQGNTEVEALDAVHGAVVLWLQSCSQRGIKIYNPTALRLAGELADAVLSTRRFRNGHYCKADTENSIEKARELQKELGGCL